MANKAKHLKPTDESVAEARLRMQATEEHSLAIVASEKAIQAKEEARLQSVHNVALLAGRAQAFSAMKLLAEYLEWKSLAAIVESQQYLAIPGVESLDQYFSHLGLGRRTAFNNLKIARTLTPEEVQLVCTAGLSRRDLLGLASLPDEQRLQIREGKVVNLENADREEIRQVIEDLVLENKAVKEETTATLVAKDKVLKAKEEVIHRQERDLRKFQKDARGKGLTLEEDAFLQQVENLRTGFDGYMLRVDPVRIDFDGTEPTPRMTAALVEAIGYMKRQVLAAYDTAVTMYGGPEDDGFEFKPIAQGK